jgi:HTH-type transcriptional regulator, sugar sensing transcriptional regulator
MTNLLIKDLTHFGLSEKEAKVYLALLELEVATVNEVAKKAGTNRSSTYVVLEALQKKGLVSTTENSSTQKFVATAPDILLRSAELSLKKEEHKFERIKSVIPDLKGMHKDTKHRPKVRVFEGREGIMSVMDEALDDNKEKILRTFTSGENLLKFVPEYMLNWSERRLKKKIEIIGIYFDNEATRMITSMSPKYGKEVYVSKDNYPFPVDTLIWDNKVGYLVVEKDLLSIIIVEGREIGVVTKSMFDMAFEQAKNTGGKFEEKE